MGIEKRKCWVKAAKRFSLKFSWIRGVPNNAEKLTDSKVLIGRGASTTLGWSFLGLTPIVFWGAVLDFGVRVLMGDSARQQRDTQPQIHKKPIRFSGDILSI